MKTELGPTLSSMLATYLEKGLLKPFVLLRKKHIDPATQLPMNNQSFNATSPYYCPLPSAFFSGLYIYFLRTLGSIEVTLKDALLIIFLLQCKLKNPDRTKKRENRKEKVKDCSGNFATSFLALDVEFL